MLRTILLLVGLALLLALLWQLGPSEILQVASRIGWYAVPIVILYSGNHATRALALRLCVLEPRLLGYRDALAIRLSGEAIQSLTVTGPFLAEPTRALLLKRRGFTLQEGFAATITEYLISSLVGAGVSVTGLVLLLRRFDPAGAIAAAALSVIILFSAFLAASFVAIACRFYLIGAIVGALGRIGILRGRLRPDIASVNRMEDLLLAVLRDRPARFVAVALVECAAQGLLVLELFWLMHALDTSPGLLPAFIVDASTKVIGIAFLFIPLQVGVSEGIYALVFDAIGLSAAAGFAVAFVRRLRSLAIASVGLALLVLLTRPVPRR